MTDNNLLATLRLRGRYAPRSDDDGPPAISALVKFDGRSLNYEDFLAPPAEQDDAPKSCQ